ncbi:hypothetical protein ABBQ32_001128 [Trebouxia sp. C0010 RCD-2024]
MGVWNLPKLDRGASAPAARGGHAIASIGSRVICFGGADRSPTPFSDLWELDTGRHCNQWTRIQSTANVERGKLVPRSGATMTAAGDILYIFGGQDPVTGGCYNDLIMLDSRTWQWMALEVSGVRPPARHSHITGLVQKNTLVVFGGAGAQGPLGDLWVFDLTSRQWSQPATQGDPPAPREMHTGTMLDDTRMLIYGGRGPDGKVLCDACLFDASSLTWRLKEPTPFARCAHTAVALPSEAGCSGNHQSDNDEPMSSGPETEHMCVLVYGGFSGDAVEGDLISIDPDGIDVQMVSRGPDQGEQRLDQQIPQARFAHGAVRVPSTALDHGKDMVVFGGVNPLQDLNDVAIWQGM